MEYMCTKFDDPSYSRFGSLKLNGSRNHYHAPFAGVVCHSQAMIDRCIKFETSSSTHYEDRLGDVKI